MLVVFTGLAACQSLAQQQGEAVLPAQDTVQPRRGYEVAGRVEARRFLGAKLMQSQYHSVSPYGWNDGFANSYKITTPDFTYFVQGTEQARILIHEIHATEILKRKSAVGMAGKAVVGRTLNLVITPARAVQGTVERFGAADNAAEVLMVVPSAAAEIVGGLAVGLKELGATGWRITTSATGTRCSSFGACTSKAGKDIWSGVNSIVGKHGAAQEIHATVGTNPYSQNKVLQRQVDRLSYTAAYTSTAVKFGYTLSGVNVLDAVTTGVGYYNNAEFVISYEDAYKARNQEKLLLKSWGVSKKDIAKLYKNPAFTNISRTQLVKAISTFGTRVYKTRMIRQAATSSTRFVADSRVAVYQYLAYLVETDRIKAFAADLPSAIALDNRNTLILPFAVDYLKWTPDIAPTITNLAALVGPGSSYLSANVHIMGQASPLFKRRAAALGIRVVEIRKSYAYK
ncbi:MAG: hypothetical protein COA91_00760 [Robiginitomaculum sp.]|nr:MAG: hypothetical protein COA91_00760 [Robiginitomaculum sp.]